MIVLLMTLIAFMVFLRVWEYEQVLDRREATCEAEKPGSVPVRTSGDRYICVIP